MKPDHRLASLLTVTLLTAAVILTACVSASPTEQDDVCKIFYEKRGWYKDARASMTRWGTPIPVLMAFIYQESSFKARAKPPRKKILWIIPGPRPASAYGYAQATNATWADYKKATGHWGANRNDFDDAMDFVGWYNHQSYRRNKIQKTDAYNLYLAYHEGQGGFARRSFTKKQWLKNVAKKVSMRAKMYRSQLQHCEKKLHRGWFNWFS